MNKDPFEAAVGRHEFEIVDRLPKAFAHPTHGYVDAVVTFQAL